MRSVSHSLRHLNPWFPVSDTVCIGLGNEVLLEEVCHWGWNPELKASLYFQFVLSGLCLSLNTWDVNFLLLLPCFPLLLDLPDSETLTTVKPWPHVHIHSQAHRKAPHYASIANFILPLVAELQFLNHWKLTQRKSFFKIIKVKTSQRCCSLPTFSQHQDYRCE